MLGLSKFAKILYFREPEVLETGAISLTYHPSSMEGSGATTLTQQQGQYSAVYSVRALSLTRVRFSRLESH